MMHELAPSNYDDLAHRHRRLIQLYDSERVFKKDGNDFSMLRIRSRLAASPVFDAAWWWREEFGNMGAYTSRSDEGLRMHQDLVHGSEFERKNEDSKVPELDMGLEILGSEFWDENLLAEFGWIDGEQLLAPVDDGNDESTF